MIREVLEGDLNELLQLYLYLHEESMPEMTEHYLTRNIRSYAFIENVVTHVNFRGKGYASECLNYAKEIAKKENCYKMMLLTGAKKEKTLEFYENAGYNSTDKTAFIQWLE